MTAPTKVKICGINSAEAIAAAADAGADMIGFVFFARSPRALDGGQAAAIRAVRPDGPPVLGLFVSPTMEEIAAVLAAVRLDGLQLYVEPDFARAVRATFGLPVWLARGVAERADLAAAESAARGLDGLVIEAKPPPGATRPGGNATAIDWSVPAGWEPSLPWILAGGLTPENVAEAIVLSGAGMVDVSSGVESAPGVKDAGMIRDFVVAARSARPFEAAVTAVRGRIDQGVS